MSFLAHPLSPECQSPATLQDPPCDGITAATEQALHEARSLGTSGELDGNALPSEPAARLTPHPEPTRHEFAARLSQARSDLAELTQLAQNSSRADESACTVLLINLLEIAECWSADVGDDRQSQVASLLEFSESALVCLKEAMADQCGDRAGRLGQIQSDAECQWGEYLRLLETLDRTSPDASYNLWQQLLRTIELKSASAPAPAVPEETDVQQSSLQVAQILTALAASSAVAQVATSVEQPRGKAPVGQATASPPDSPFAESAGSKPANVAPAPPVPAVIEIDPELRSAYVEDAERGVALIEQTLLDLERNPANADSLQQLCRALHTMKGASASVGLSELARYLHDLEDFVQFCSASGQSLEIQPMLRGVDAVRAQMSAIVVPGQSPRDAFADPADTPSAAGVRLASAAPTTRSIVSTSAVPRAAEESIRVEATRLDRLMDLLGELVISRNRRDTQVGRLKQLHSELMRTSGRLRMLGDCASLAIDAGQTPRSAVESDAASNSSVIEIVNDISEIARSLRELYEPILDENLATSRLMGQFRHELMELRRLPLSGLFLRLQRAARDAAHSEGKQVQFEIRGQHAGLEPSLQDRLYEPLLHLVRNAVSHGIEREADRLAAGKNPIGTVTIETRGDPTSFVIEVRDDGKGLDYEAIKRRGLELGLLDSDRPANHWQLAQLTFHPGFSTRNQVTEISGRGVGLDVVANVIDRLRGNIEVESLPGRGTSVRLRIPLRSSIEHTMVFRVDGHLFALPMQFVQAARPMGQGHQANADTRSGYSAPDPGPGPTTFTDVSIMEAACVRVRDLLSLNSTPRPAEEHSLIVSRSMAPLSRPADSHSGSARSCGAPQSSRIALMVDAVIGPEEVVVRSLPGLFKRHRLLAGVTLSGAREIVLLLDGRELMERATELAASSAHATQTHGSVSDERRASAPMKVLVVDDSVSVRRTLSRALERRGFVVTEAADGLEALDLLRTFTFSLVVTDLEMPRLGGMELLAEIRRTRRTRPLNVAIVSGLVSQEMQNRAKELGANGYFAKPVTDATVNQLLASVRLEGASE